MNYTETLKRTKPYIPESDHEQILSSWQGILESGMFIQGKYVEEFECRFAYYCGTKYAIATNSGASALEIAIRASGIEGKKIIVPTQTFVATVSSIIRSGNIPVIVDIDMSTQCLSLGTVMPNLDEDVAAVVLVHMAGLITPDYDIIKKLCDDEGLLLFEDASHAVGASTFNRKAGSLGAAAAFSLFATKIITTGEGGIITTNDENIYNEAKILRNHGSVRNAGDYEGLDYGVTCTYASCNYRMPELSAVLGISQMRHVESFVKHRNLLANKYVELLQDVRVTLPRMYESVRQTWWQYIIVLPGTHVNRFDVCRELLARGVPTANAYYPACHEQPAFLQYCADRDFRSANFLLNRHVALPMYVEMTGTDVKFVCDALKAVLL